MRGGRPGQVTSPSRDIRETQEEQPWKHVNLKGSLQRHQWIQQSRFRTVGGSWDPWKESLLVQRKHANFVQKDAQPGFEPRTIFAARQQCYHHSALFNTGENVISKCQSSRVQCFYWCRQITLASAHCCVTLIPLFKALQFDWKPIFDVSKAQSEKCSPCMSCLSAELSGSLCVLWPWLEESLSQPSEFKGNKKRNNNFVV